MEVIMKTAIITRKEAKEAGLTRYFTGKPCIHGHVAPRLVSNKTCIECDRLRKQAKRAKASAKASMKATEKVFTEIKVASVQKRQVRVVRFKVMGQNRIGRGRKKYQPEIIEDRVVNL
jgi:hypothetical protein